MIKIIKNHPQSLWWLSLIYACYAISYGVLFANLLLYSNLSKSIGFSESHAIEFFASFSTLTFVLPILGGVFCDKFGFVSVAKTGLILSVLGFVSLSFDSFYSLYVGVALCLTGNALVMPSVWAMVGLIYNSDAGLRESGTTLFYLLFNIGFLIAFSLSGTVAVLYHYSVMFLLFGSGALLALIILFFSSRNIPNLPSAQNSIVRLLLGCLLIFTITIGLLIFLVVNNILIWLLVLAIFCYLWNLSRQENYHLHAKNIKLFIYLCFLGLIGITIYNSEFGLLPEFAHHAINLQVGNWRLPGQIITSLDPLFCIIIGFLLSILWQGLANKNINPKPAVKLSFGIMLPALGYLLLALLLFLYAGSKLSLLWLVPVFILFVIGELLVLPIGIAMASELAPKNKAGLFMGTWNIMQGASALLAGYIAYFTVVKSSQLQTHINHQYSKVFFYSGIVIFVIGLLSLLRNKFYNLFIYKS